MKRPRLSSSETDGAWTIGSNIVASQVAIHREWGGVVPELASRQHIRDICGVVRAALDTAKTDLTRPRRDCRDAGAGARRIAARRRVVRQVARALARIARSSPVHHLAGHIESLFLQHGDLPLPLVALVVSGGHTSLYVVDRTGLVRARSAEHAMMRRGRRTTRSRSCSASDIPGGPIVDKRAREGQRRGDRVAVDAHDPRRSERAHGERVIWISASAD